MCHRLVTAFPRFNFVSVPVSLLCRFAVKIIQYLKKDNVEFEFWRTLPGGKLEYRVSMIKADGGKIRTPIRAVTEIDKDESSDMADEALDYMKAGGSEEERESIFDAMEDRDDIKLPEKD